MFVILKGHVHIELNDKIIFTLNENQIFGEIEFFSRQHSNYTLRSDKFTKLIQISRKNFLRTIYQIQDQNIKNQAI